MTAGKHHPQLVVLDDLRREKSFNGRCECPLAMNVTAQLGLESSSRALTPEDVNGAILGCGHEPGGRIFGHTSKLPNLQRPAEGVLNDIFRQGEVVGSEDAR